MSRTITVIITDKQGYGKAGYKVTTYSGDSAKTDAAGECFVKVSGDDSIMLEGTTIAKGMEHSFKNPFKYEV